MTEESISNLNDEDYEAADFRHSEEMFRAATDSLREQSFVAMSNRVSQKPAATNKFSRGKSSPKPRRTSRTVSS